MERNNVLLKITDLRQYFPVGKKKGLYVKANDGISLNIYEGETVGLVGESARQVHVRTHAAAALPSDRRQDDVLWRVP